MILPFSPHSTAASQPVWLLLHLGTAAPGIKCPGVGRLLGKGKEKGKAEKMINNKCLSVDGLQNLTPRFYVASEYSQRMRLFVYDNYALPVQVYVLESIQHLL